MPEEGLWGIDPTSEEPIFIPYSVLEADTRWSFFKPIGGFCYPVGQFAAMSLPETPFYIKDWLPKRGRCRIYAPAKTGKSYLALQLARAIGSGLPFLGEPTAQGRVLLVQFELGPEVFQKRILSTKHSYPEVFVGTSFSLKLDSSAGQHLLDVALEAIHPQVLILDPLYKTIQGDENETQDMRTICDILDLRMEAYQEDQLSVVVFHHTGKDSSRGGRGASVMEDWVDSDIMLKKTSKDGEPLRIAITPKVLRHAANPPEGLKAELGEDFEFALLSEVETVKEQVANYLKAALEAGSGSVQRANILRAGIGSNASVQEALNSLCESQQAQRDGRGVYSWIEEE